MVVGPDGNFWFTQANARDIGTMNTSGQLVEYTIGSGANGEEIINGPNGALWFTEATAQAIGEITTAGKFSNFPVPNVTFQGDTFQPNPKGLAEGPDGNVYFSDSGTTTVLGGLLPPYLGFGEITPTGTVSQPVLQSASVTTFAPSMFFDSLDQNIWFPMDGQSAVGELEFTSPSGGGGGGGTGGGGGGGTTTSNVPADVFVSSVTIVIPAGQTTGSVTIMGDGDTVASDESIDVTAFEISGGGYSQVPQEVTATQTASAPNGASISGTVEENTTGNPGMAGVTVFIDANQNGIFDPTSDPFTTTTGSGAYVFDGLQITTPKTDTVDEILPFGFTAVTPASGSLQVPLTTNLQVTGQNFINAPPPVQTTIQLSATNLNGQSLANPTFNENNGQIIVVATLPSVATNNVVINLVFSGSAVEGLDYVASSLSIVVLAGQSSGSIMLTGLPRGVDQTSNPNIVISIASVVNGSVSNSTVTATILEQSDVLTGVISGERLPGQQLQWRPGFRRTLPGQRDRLHRATPPPPRSTRTSITSRSPTRPAPSPSTA